ncbi:MAG: hypothetical protein IOD12_16810 [Silvanigrellales bacterium]|nr:hypothetical protein [Silvanigrellales bacterium]
MITPRETVTRFFERVREGRAPEEAWIQVEASGLETQIAAARAVGTG